MKTLSLLSFSLLFFLFLKCPPEGDPPRPAETLPIREDSLFVKAGQLKDGFKPDSAMLLYAELEPVFQKAGNWEKAIACRRNTAYCLWISHQAGKAMAMCEQMLPEAEQHLGENHPEVASIYTMMGNVHADKRTGADFNLCLGYFEKALEINKKAYGDKHSAVASAYERFGIAYYLIDDYAGALPFYEKAKDALGPLSDENAGIYSKIIHNQGLLYDGMGWHAMSLECFEKSYQIATQTLKLRNSKVVKSLENKARLHLKLGDIEKAMVTYEEAEALEKEVGEPGSKQRAYNLAGVGDCYFAMGEYAKARSYYEQCLPFWTTGVRDDLYALLQELQNMGNCYLRENKPEDALPYFQWAWAAIDTAYDADSYSRYGPLVNLGNTSAQAGNTSDALAYLNKALAIAQKKVGVQHPSTAKVKELVAGVHFQTGDLVKAQTWADEALASYSKNKGQNPPASEISDLPGCIDLVLLQGNILAKSFEENGNPALLQQALQRYTYGQALTDSLKTTLSSKASRQELQKKVSAISEKALGCTHRLWQLTGEDGLLETAFVFFEKSKSALLMATLRETQAENFAGVPAKILKEEQHLQSKCAYYRQLLNNPPEGTEEFKKTNWQQGFFQARHQLDSLTDRLENDFPEYFRLKNDTRVASLHEVQDRVKKENTTLLAFFWGDSSLYLLAVSPDAARLSRVPDPQAVQELLLNLKKHLHDFRPGWQNDGEKREEFQSFCSIASALHDLLVGPFLPQARAGKLVIVPDGLLGYLPFSVLLTKPLPAGAASYPNWRSLPYLFQEYAILSPASATQWLESNQPGGWPGYRGFAPGYESGNLLAGTVSRSDSLRLSRSWPAASRDGGLQPLLFNRKEVEESAEITGGKAYYGYRATEAAFKKAAVEARILHCAMHALTNDADPMYSALMFSPEAGTQEDGRLYAWELYSLRLDADLAVLSACNTGAGQLQKGEGVMSLSHAFQYAGCASVLMSLWPANDAATKDLTVGFFKNMKQGKPKSEALRQSGLDYLANVKNDELAHPAYWANFVLIGDDSPLRLGRGWLSKWWWAMAVFAGLSGWVLFNFYRTKRS